MLVLIPSVMAMDLANYPEMFMVQVDNKIYLNAIIVVGNNAAASDVVGAIDIATSLNYDTGAVNQNKKSVEAVLASEIAGKEKDNNLILVGGPCINSATAYVMGFPANCADGFYKGKARIELFKNGDNIALVVAGMTAQDTRLAAKVLSQELYDLSGPKIEVSGTSIKDVSIN